MRGVKWIVRSVAGVAVASVLMVGAVVHSPPAVAAPQAAPWTTPPAVGSWYPLDTPNGIVVVKVVAPGIAVYPGQLSDGSKHAWGGFVPPETYSDARQNLFVAKVEALIGFLQTTQRGSELLAGFGRIAPLPDPDTGSWVRPGSTFTSGGQPVAINHVLGISRAGDWGTTVLSGQAATNGEGSVSIMNIPEDVRPTTTQVGDDLVMLMPDGSAFHELIHAWRSLNGYDASLSPTVTVTVDLDGDPSSHPVEMEEALTTGSPLLLMNALGYQVGPNGEILLHPDPRAARAIDLASDRESAMLRRHGPSPDGLVAPITSARILGQGFTEHSYLVSRGMPARDSYLSILYEGEGQWFGWRDSSLQTFVDAVSGYTPSDVTDPENSRWLVPVPEPAACGAGSHASCAWSGSESPPTTLSSTALTESQAAVEAGKAVVSSPKLGPVLSLPEMQSMSATDLMTLAQRQFDVMVRTQGSFGGVGDPGKTFVGLPQTRDVLNRVDFGGRSTIGDGLDGLDYIDWVKSLKGAFGADVSNLQTAATLTAMVPLIAESMGIAAAVESGDKAAIAANTLSLLTSIASLFITNPTVGLVVGLIGMLIVSLIYAFSAPDPSPVALEYLKKHRDAAFAEVIPKLAADFARIVSEAFALSQAQQLIALGVADATIDSAAEQAAVQDPRNGTVVAEEAATAKRELHTTLQASLTAQKASLTTAMKAAFRELVTTEVADPATQRVVTDQILPLYESSGYAWDDGTDAVTPGWEYFVAVAESSQEYACLNGRVPGGRNRTAADFAAGADLQDCANVIYVMNTAYVPNVKALQSTRITAPSAATLDAAIDTGLNAPATVKNLTVATVPAPKKTTRDRPWRITYPVLGIAATPGATPQPVPGLITGQGKAGHSIQVRDPDGHALCSTDVNVYGTWGCVTSDLIAPGFEFSLWEKDTDLGARVKAPGTRLTIGTPSPSPVSPEAPLTVTGTGTAGHQVTLTVHHPAGDTPATTEASATVGANDAWSYTIPAGTLRPGRTYSVTAADKSIYDFRSATFTTTGTSSAPPAVPFEARYEAETGSTGGTVFTLATGHVGRKYAAGEEADFRVTVPAAGEYRVTVTYSAGSRGNGTLVTVYPDNSSIASQRTEISSSSTTATVPLKLNAGSNTVTLVPAPGKQLPDLDLITLTSQ